MPTDAERDESRRLSNLWQRLHVMAIAAADEGRFCDEHVINVQCDAIDTRLCEIHA